MTDQDAAAQLVNTFLEHLIAGRFDAVRMTIRPDAHVRILDPSGAWTGRGPNAVDRLIDVLARGGGRGNQVRSEIIPASPTYTILSASRQSDGSTKDEMLALTLGEGKVIGVAYYALPLGEVGTVPPPDRSVAR